MSYQLSDPWLDQNVLGQQFCLHYPLTVYPASTVKGHGSPSQRRIDGIYGTTLAADIAQTALLKKRGQKYSGPDGYFNNSLCPSEFQLISETNNYGDVTFTHLTIAEINGGIDGLLLGMISEDWDRRSELSLSQVWKYLYLLVKHLLNRILFSWM